MDTVNHRTGTEEQKTFKHRMVEQVINRAEQANRRQHRHIIRHADHCHTDTHQDNPDVFHGVPRQQTFDIVLRQRIHNAENGRDRAEAQYHDTPPALGCTQQVDTDFNDPEDTDFHHHTGHQCGGVRRCSRVSLRQPAVQR